MIQKEMSDTTRIKNLRKVINDNETLGLGFSRTLLRKYIVELTGLKVKVKREKDSDKRKREIYNIIKTKVEGAKVHCTKINANKPTLQELFSNIGFENRRLQIRESIRKQERDDRESTLRIRAITRIENNRELIIG